MKKNRAFAIVLFVMLLLVVYGLCVLIVGVDAHRNRPLIEENSLSTSIGRRAFMHARPFESRAFGEGRFSGGSA